MYTYPNINKIIQDKTTLKPAGASVGERLKQYRKQEGFTLKEIAAYLRKSPSTLYRYENDIIEISYKDLTLLTMIYYNSMDYFCEPLYKKNMEHPGSVAALLIKYSIYSGKFYNAHIYFPTKSEQEAIAIISGYTLFPLPPLL